MDSKGDAEPQEERPSSPMRVLQHFSGGAFKVAGEALHMSPMGPGGHRRCQSELGSRGVERNNSLQKLKSHVNKAWRWGGKSREDALANFNPEVMANQKRQWYQLHPKSLDCVNNKEPTSLFEHFVIVGLHPDANLEAVEHSFARRKKWEKDKGKPEFRDCRKSQQQKVIEPTLEPQLLFKYPPAKKLTLRMKDLAPFCFPEGVKAWLLERTPSLSELNELVYGQEHLGKDDLSFVFAVKIKLQMCLSINSTRQFRTFVVKVIPSVIAQSCKGWRVYERRRYRRERGGVRTVEDSDRTVERGEHEGRTAESGEHDGRTVGEREKGLSEWGDDERPKQVEATTSVLMAERYEEEKKRAERVGGRRAS
ncbi:hypothetical protein LR48_Vigan831s003700 [Vigna angularis]|uniref:Uncharacterized protein n=1 Tax=Phaseolus angularis TaxID=3914 RepID=A0A0L9TIF9_PHAAN|nr:hypothetical protein LR48_Vigan831s003700 [Vigna angularis]